MASSPGEPKKADPASQDRHPAPAQTDNRGRHPEKQRTDDAPAGEEMTGEGSPGLTITGGGGHA